MKFAVCGVAFACIGFVIVCTVFYTIADDREYDFLAVHHGCTGSPEDFSAQQQTLRGTDANASIAEGDYRISKLGSLRLKSASANVWQMAVGNDSGYIVEPLPPKFDFSTWADICAALSMDRPVMLLETPMLEPDVRNIAIELGLKQVKDSFDAHEYISHFYKHSKARSDQHSFVPFTGVVDEAALAFGNALRGALHKNIADDVIKHNPESMKIPRSRLS